MRELSAGEGPLWRDLRLQALLDSPDAFGRTYDGEAGRSEAEWHERVDAAAADPSAASLVVEVDGEPAGMAYCRLDPQLRAGELYAMWVRPGARLRGAGRALLRYGLDWMRERGALEAHLGVTETNRPALELYRSCGFVDTGARQTLRPGSALRVIVMRRPLAGE